VVATKATIDGGQVDAADDDDLLPVVSFYIASTPAVSSPFR
jgi:hypothetical protein